MKSKIFYKAIFIAAYLLVVSCHEKLIEKPHDLTPLFLKTKQGLEQSLNAAYSGTRQLWGHDEYFHLSVAGTDLWKRGIDGHADINEYNSDYDPDNSYVRHVWEDCYKYINVCNAVIDFGPSVPDMDESTINKMVAEAKFLRANYYFILMRFWGRVTLADHFNSQPTTSASRAPIDTIYKFIIEDLKGAIKYLPPSPLLNSTLPGKANGAAARALLAKVYLTRAYSPTGQLDDFKNAADMSVSLINDAPSLGLGLLQNFGDIYKEGNEENKEVLWTVQYTSDLAYNDPGNKFCFFYVPKYDIQAGMQRSTLYGRPYTRECPTNYLLDTIFAEKENDLRYNNTFRTVWLCNDSKGIPVWPDPLPKGAPVNAVPGQPKFALGDTAIYMPGYNVTDEQIAAAPYLLIPPRNYTISLYPSMKKYADSKRTDKNANSNRPIIVYRLGETYLIAAEALFQEGNVSEATKYINAIRERAAYPTGDKDKMDISPSELSLNFILDERARELCGELQRWMDLVRTHQLVNRVKMHNKPASLNIQNRDTLRPIPQRQIDRVTTGKQYQQNQGW